MNKVTINIVFFLLLSTAYDEYHALMHIKILSRLTV